MICKKLVNFPKVWRNAICVLLLLILYIGFLFSNTFGGMVSIWWRSETFTHGFLVPPIVAWLIWRKKEIFLKINPVANYWVLFLVLLFSFFWLMGDLSSTNSVAQISAVGLIVLSFPAILGFNVTKIIIFPLLFLFFSVPLGEFLLPLFMEWTAGFTIFALRLSGVPVYREGLQFVIPSGNWSVVEACSGIRYLIASVTVGTLFSYLNYNSLFKRIVFVCFSVVVPVLANWIRAYMIVMLGHLSGNTLAVGVDHLIYGWVFFGVVIMLMFIIGSRWSEDSDLSEKDVYIPVGYDYIPKYRVFQVFLLFIFLVSSCVIWREKLNSDFYLKSYIYESPSFLRNDWIISSKENVEWNPDFKDYSEKFNSVYEKKDFVIGLYSAYYKNQNFDRKMISSDNLLVSSKNKNFIKINEFVKKIEIESHVFSVLSTELRGKLVSNQSTPVTLLAWQFYWVDGKFTSNEYLAKFYLAVQKLIGGKDDSAIFVIYVKNESGIDSNYVLRSFLKDNFMTLKNYLDGMAK
jgi:exosortase A